MRWGSVAAAAALVAGDVGITQNPASPDGSGLSIALPRRALLPTGHQPTGDATWAANRLIPVIRASPASREKRNPGSRPG